MPKRTTFSCGSCHNPVYSPELVESFTFPQDIDLTFDLLEGRFNTAICPVCRTKTALLAPVAVINPEEKRVLLVAPSSVPQIDDLVQRLMKTGHVVTSCQDYDE